MTLPGVHACSITNKLSSLSVLCQENTKARSSQFRAELVDLQLGLETSLMSSNPTFHFSSVRPGTLFNLTIYRKSYNEYNWHTATLHFLSKILIINHLELPS